MDTPKIKSVKALPNMKLSVTFENEKTCLYDCAPLLQRDAFRLLQNDAFFNAVQVDPGGYGISWNDDIDLSEYELWTNGVPVEEFVETGR